MYIYYRSKIHVWAEQHALYHWTVKDDDKSSLFLSNMLIHHETYTRASQDKRRNSVATKWAEKVSRIWNRFIKIDFIKFKLKVESSRATKTILYFTNIFSRSKFPTFPMFSFKNLRKTPLRYDLSRDVPKYPRTSADKWGVTLFGTWL